MPRRRLIASAGAILALLTFFFTTGAVLFTTGAAQADTGNGANVKIQNMNSRLCLTPAGSSAGLNVTIVQYSCQADPARSYTLAWDAAAQAYQIRNMKNDLCLSPAGGSTGLNVVIVQYTCDSDQSRHWYVGVRSGYWQLKNMRSGLCLSPAGGSTDLNAAIVQYTCDGATARTWDYYTPQFFRSFNAGGLCVTVAGGSATPNTAAVTYTCDGQPARLWKIISNPSLLYGVEVQNVATGLCLSPAGGSYARKTPIVEYYCDGDQVRQWNFGDTNGVFNFAHSSGWCLGIAGDATGPDNALELDNCDRTPSHTWAVYLG